MGHGQNLAIIAISASVIAVFTVFASAEEGLIPSWIKTTAGFWVNDEVSDSEFVSAIEFLITNGIIEVPTQEDPMVKELQDENEQLRVEINSLKDQLENQPQAQPEPKPTSKKSIFDSDIITCKKDEYGYIDIKGSITNNDSKYHSPELILYARDSNNNILTFVEHIELDVAPGQTVYFDRSVESHPSATGCGIKFDRLN